MRLVTKLEKKSWPFLRPPLYLFVVRVQRSQRTASEAARPSLARVCRKLNKKGPVTKTATGFSDDIRLEIHKTVLGSLFEHMWSVMHSRMKYVKFVDLQKKTITLVFTLTSVKEIRYITSKPKAWLLWWSTLFAAPVYQSSWTFSL